MHTVKPIDREAVLACGRETKAIITVEEHNVIGGLGSAVLETLAEERGCPVTRIGIPDVFPMIGPTFELRRLLGLTSTHIVEKARSLVRK
jgi:transketolase